MIQVTFVGLLDLYNTQYLTLTRLDISYSVNYVSQCMHSPTIMNLEMTHC